MTCCGCGTISFYTHGGGSGSGYIGTFKLTKGTLSVKVGKGQHYISTSDSSYVFSSPQDSYVNGVVTVHGGSIPSGGATPTLSMTPQSTTLNSAGNAGSNNGSLDTTDDSGNITSTGGVPGASVYGGYGVGDSCWSLSTDVYASPGYVKIVYKGKK